MIIPSGHRFLFELFLSLGGRDKSNGGFTMTWNAIVSSIWRVCNDDIFNGVQTIVKKWRRIVFFYLKMISREKIG